MVFSSLQSFWTWLITDSVNFPGALLLQEHLRIAPTSPKADLHPSDAADTTPARAASEAQPPLEPADVAARDPSISSSGKVAPTAMEGTRGLLSPARSSTHAHLQSSRDGGWERVCVTNPAGRR